MSESESEDEDESKDESKDESTIDDGNSSSDSGDGMSMAELLACGLRKRKREEAAAGGQ